MGERANIDVEYLEGLEGTLRESLEGDSSLLGDDSSRIGSQIDRRCLPPIVPPLAHGPAGRAPSCLPSGPSDSRPIADPLPDASAQNHRPRSSATPDQRASTSIVPPSESGPSVPPCVQRVLVFEFDAVWNSDQPQIAMVVSEILPTAGSSAREAR